MRIRNTQSKANGTVLRPTSDLSPFVRAGSPGISRRDRLRPFLAGPGPANLNPVFEINRVCGLSLELFPVTPRETAVPESGPPRTIPFEFQIYRRIGTHATFGVRMVCKWPFDVERILLKFVFEWKFVRVFVKMFRRFKAHKSPCVYFFLINEVLRYEM